MFFHQINASPKATLYYWRLPFQPTLRSPYFVFVVVPRLCAWAAKCVTQILRLEVTQTCNVINITLSHAHAELLECQSHDYFHIPQCFELHPKPHYSFAPSDIKSSNHSLPQLLPCRERDLISIRNGACALIFSAQAEAAEPHCLRTACSSTQLRQSKPIPSAQP